MSRAKMERDETIWKELAKISLSEAADHFIASLKGHTQRTYRAAFTSIFQFFIKQQVFDPKQSLQTFALSNLEFLLDQIREQLVGAEATKQARAAAFISLTRYLQRATGGVVRTVIPKKEQAHPTFRKIRNTAVTQSLTKLQWNQFFLSLKRTSFRDYLIAKMILQGAKRVGEVLTAEIHQIQWNTQQIIFKQFKSKEIEKFTVITYPTDFLKELREYLGERIEGPIFITKHGKNVTQSHLYRSFSQAGRQASISFIVHPHVLRASTITYLSSQGYSAEQIMKISGHAGIELVKYYDKTPIENNLSQEVNLIEDV
ncbi:MAG: site-specific integrase [Methylococcales bacterium]|nr:site-specific integrase [Methylococcales bacterium]